MQFLTQQLWDVYLQLRLPTLHCGKHFKNSSPTGERKVLGEEITQQSSPNSQGQESWRETKLEMMAGVLNSLGFLIFHSSQVVINRPLSSATSLAGFSPSQLCTSITLAQFLTLSVFFTIKYKRAWLKVITVLTFFLGISDNSYLFQ